MKDSAGIKRENKAQIRKLLISGKSYTKQQIALQTGLSVASCNTHLNEMAATGEVIGEKQKLHDVGRSSVVYKLNEDFESILCIFFELIRGVKSITTTVVSQLGNTLHRQVCCFDLLDAAAIEQEAAAALDRFSNASQIVVDRKSVV